MRYHLAVNNFVWVQGSIVLVMSFSHVLELHIVHVVGGVAMCLLMSMLMLV